MTKENSPHSHTSVPPPVAQNHAPPHVGAATINVAEEIRLSDIIGVLVRHRAIVFSITLLFTVLAALYCNLTQPLYTASTLLQIDVRKKNIVNIESVSTSFSGDDSQIKSELDSINSPTLAGMVVDELQLQKDPEFNPSLRELGVVDSFVKTLKEDYLSFLVQKKEDDTLEGVAEENSERAAAIRALRSKLRVSKKERSYTIVIEVTSESSKKAQLLANTFANAYLRNQLALKFDASRRANQWLSDRLKELQKKLEDSERNVQQFKLANNLTQDNAKSVVEQQLAQLTTELVNARTARTQAEAKLANIRQDVNSVPEVLSSALIQSLRTQEVQVVRKRAELSSRYGPKHPKMINVNNELEDLSQKIKFEIENIITSIENEFKLSKSREEALQKSLEDLQGGKESEISESATVQLAELTRQMEADKALYESFLTRFKETSEQGLEQADAEVISYADLPLSPSYPPKSLIITVTAIFSFLFSIAIAFFIEEMDNTFRGGPQFEKSVGLRVLGMIPYVEKPENQKYTAVMTPSSVFFESLRSVLTALYFSRPNNIPKSILITSSVPGEGKTFFSISFSNMLARSGMKVLLIDCDLKRASLSQHLVGGSTAKRKILADFITGKVSENDIIYQNSEPGLHYIASYSNTSYSQNILESDRMKYLIQVMSLRYDYVVLDCPPVMAVSDALVLAPLVDAIVYAVQWGKTPQKIVTNAVNMLKHSKGYIAGAVLTQVNLKKHGSYGYGDTAYYYSEYKDYYTTNQS